MVSDELMKHIFGNLSAEGIDRQRKHEYRQGYPQATEAEIQLLMDADDKAGYPPQSLGHARYIMRSSTGSRLPAPTAKDFDDAALAIAATHRENLALAAGMTFVDWDHRPAVLVDGKAFAITSPGDDWKRVSRQDVFGTSAVMSESDWRKGFARFGSLDLSKIPQPQPSGILRPRHVRPSGERLKALWLIGMALAESLNQPRVPKERETAEPAEKKDSLPPEPPIAFINWDWRPAVLVDDETAFAVLMPGGPWKSVDRLDVGQSGALSEDVWRKTFRGKFGVLDLSKIPTRKRGYSPAGALVMARTLKQVAEEIGDGELMAHGIELERRALEAIKLGLSELPDAEETGGLN